MRVLVIEDEAGLGEVFRDFLLELGHQPLGVPRAEAALGGAAAPRPPRVTPPPRRPRPGRAAPPPAGGARPAGPWRSPSGSASTRASSTTRRRWRSARR